MSIIYEALKKTQESPEGVNQQAALPKGKHLPSPKAPPLKKQLFLSAAGVALGISFTWVIMNKPFVPAAPVLIEKTGQPSPLNPPRNNKTPGKNPDISASSRGLPHLILNGIVLSEDGSIAMINNQICKAGDEIEGAKIVEITASRVVLSLKNQEIVLKAGR